MSIIKTTLLFVLFGLTTFTFGQDLLQTKINFNVSEVSVDSAIDQLATQTGLDIAYSQYFFKNSIPISLDLKDQTVRQVLNEILAKTNVEFKMLGENRVLLFIDKSNYIIFSGYVEDEETGERLVGARVYSSELIIGTITNEYGYFSIKIPGKNIEMAISSVGFKTKIVELDSIQLATLPILLEHGDDLPAVVIDGNTDTEQLEYSSIATDQDNIIEVSERLTQYSPSLNGQTDYLRVIQMLPGVQAQSDGFGGINIRGNESGQNLMMMDGSPIYIPYHLLGLYSTYNPETVKSVKLVKGNFPARYGGAISSILDVQIREGDLYKYKGSAEVNLLNGALSFEGPIKKGKGSFLIAGRYSPMAYFFNPVFSRIYFNNTVDELTTTFYDFNIKTNYKFSKKDRVYLSFFNGKDNMYQSAIRAIDKNFTSFTTFDLEWENRLASVRWNHLFSKSLFMNVTLNYSNYSHRFSSRDEFEYVDLEKNVNDLFAIDNRSNNVDYGAKADFDYLAGKYHQFRFGIKYNYRYFTPRFYFQQKTTFDYQNQNIGEDDYDFENYYENKSIPDILAHQSSVYFEDHIKTKRWYFNVGLRLTNFANIESNYLNLQPRILTRFKVNEKIALTLVGNRRFQYLHLIANPAIQLPNDLWLPSDSKIKPQELYETEFSIYYKVRPRFTLNATAYYRVMSNLYAYPETFDYLSNTADYLQYDFLVNGMGESKGIEFIADFADAKKGVLVTYTISKSTRQFDSLNLGKTFYSNFDNRHQIKVAFHHSLNKSFKFGLNVIYFSPRPHLDVLKFSDSANGSFSNINQDPAGEKNTTRGEAYTRLDLNIQYLHVGNKLTHSVKFGVYNLFSSNNPAVYEVQYVDQITGNIISNPLKSLPVLPNFSYRVSF